VNSSHVYWTSFIESHIGRANLDGTNVNQSLIGPTNPFAVETDAQHLYWSKFGGGIGRANLDGTNVDQGFIALSGSPTTGLAIDSAHIYWTSRDTGVIGRASLDGSNVDPSFITGASDPYGIAVDSTHLYWVNNGDETIGRASIDGSHVVQSFISGGAEYGISVDATVGTPETQITAGPQGPTPNNSPSFAFSNPDQPESTFECRLDIQPYAACGSPKSYAGLADGTHTFKVRAISELGTDAPAVRTFTVDTVAPETSIVAGPNGTSNDPTPTFKFSASEPSSFTCKLDSNAYSPCSSPRTLSRLTDGSHVFSVRARDTVGHTDATPASRSFTVKTGAVSRSGSTLLVTAAPGAADNISITRPSPDSVRISDLPGSSYAGSGLHAGNLCTQAGDSTVMCQAAGTEAVYVAASDLGDQVVNSTGIASALVGGAGNDTLVGGFGADTLNAGAGANKLQARGGNDQLLARNLVTDPLIDCGAGADKADLDKLPKDPNSVISGCETKARH
jgi:hypothetical protein